MFKKIFSSLLSILLVFGMLALAFNIQPAKTEPMTITVPDNYPTIQEAINHANPEDTIFVKAGTYYENVIVDKAVSLIGEDQITTIIDGNGIGNIFTVIQDHVTIEKFTVQNSGSVSFLPAGIQIYTASYCNISGNIIVDNYYGIDLVFYSNHNIISKNSIASNDKAGIMFGVQSSNNTVTENRIIANNEEGILICGSSNYNIISENNIEANKMVGIGVVTDSSHNLFYNNNIIENTFKQAQIESGSNLWDDGYPSGGNYWSDHNPPDLYSGPYQNETGSDGIGDLPYIIDENNRDRYPLIYPYGYVPNPDINNDGIIDILDLVTIALAYGSVPGIPIWKPYADIVQDGIIDIFDLVMIALHYGETYP